MAGSVEAVYDLIDGARGVLTYEEREALVLSGPARLGSRRCGQRPGRREADRSRRW
jgi:hypothetical protein